MWQFLDFFLCFFSFSLLVGYEDEDDTLALYGVQINTKVFLLISLLPLLFLNSIFIIDDDMKSSPSQIPTLASIPSLES